MLNGYKFRIKRYRDFYWFIAQKRIPCRTQLRYGWVKIGGKICMNAWRSVKKEVRVDTVWICAVTGYGVRTSQLTKFDQKLLQFLWMVFIYSADTTVFRVFLTFSKMFRKLSRFVSKVKLAFGHGKLILTFAMNYWPKINRAIG